MKYIPLFILLSLIAFSNTTFALEPAGDDIGAQAERFRLDAEQKQKELEPKKAKPPKIEFEEEKTVIPDEETSFVLTEVVITGLTIFKAEDFYPVYQPYIGSRITFKDIDIIIEGIKSKYKQKGYLTTIVYLPEQEIKNGRVEIRIVEGKMGELKVEGNKWFSLELLKRYFHTKKDEPLDINKVQKDLLRLNQNPDREVTTTISAGKKTGTSDVTLKVTEYRPQHVGASFDNYGTRLVGRQREMAWFRDTNTLGLDDSLFIAVLLSEDSLGETASYLIPLDTYGTKFGFNFTHFTMQVGKEFKSFDIKGRTQMYTPYISRELILSEDMELNVNAGLDIKCIKKTMLGERITDDQLRIPYFGFDATLTDSYGGQTTFTPQFAFSTEHFLGASAHDHPSASREGTGGFFFKYSQLLKRVQMMPCESYIVASSQFEMASHTLPSSEQFQLGGANSIRGYPEGDYLADVGAQLSVDWVFPMYPVPESVKLPHSDTPLRRQIEPVIFMDIGGGKLKKVMPGERDDKFLMGVGGGLRIHFAKNLYGRFDWAKRVGDRVTGGTGRSTFYWSIQGEL